MGISLAVSDDDESSEEVEEDSKPRNGPRYAAGWSKEGADGGKFVKKKLYITYLVFISNTSIESLIQFFVPLSGNRSRTYRGFQTIFIL